MKFDLIREPWVPVLRDGEPALVSLSEAVLDSGMIAGLATSTPTQMPAVLRQVLVPVVLDALGPPRSRREWSTLFGQGGFTDKQAESINAYLDSHRDRFDLFDPEQPFAQVGGLRTAKGETKPVSLLIPSAATGNNVPLFSVRTDGDALALTPAEAVVWLLHAHCWDTAAIKTGVVGDPEAETRGKTMGNPTGPLGQLGVIVPVGRTLFDTIVLNLPILPDGLAPQDRPQWKTLQQPRWEKRHACGILDLLTWQSRRIRLFPETSSDGKIVVCRVIVAAGDRLSEIPEFEPHTVWRIDTRPKQGPPVTRPRRHVPGKAAWRGLDGLLAMSRRSDDTKVLTSGLLRQVGDLRVDGGLADGYPLCVQTCGVEYGNQSAVVEEVIADSLPLPVAALAAKSQVRDLLLEVAEQAEQAADALNRLSADLRRAVGGVPIPWDKGQRPGTLLISGLDPYVRRLFAGVQQAGDDEKQLDDGQRAWEIVAWKAARRIAANLLAEVPPAAFTGHTVDGKPYRAATAEQGFSRRLRTILPLATDQERGHDG